MTTFEQDGYNDAINGRSCSPPASSQTTVFEREYIHGYMDGYVLSGRAADDYSRLVTTRRK